MGCNDVSGEDFAGTRRVHRLFSHSSSRPFTHQRTAFTKSTADPLGSGCGGLGSFEDVGGEDRRRNMSLATPSSVHVHTPVRPFTLRRAGHREQGGSAQLLMRWVSKTWAEKERRGNTSSATLSSVHVHTPVRPFTLRSRRCARMQCSGWGGRPHTVSGSAAIRTTHCTCGYQARGLGRARTRPSAGRRHVIALHAGGQGRCAHDGAGGRVCGPGGSARRAAPSRVCMRRLQCRAPSRAPVTAQNVASH